MPVAFSPETEARWIEVAARCGMTPEEWLVMKLDETEHHLWWSSLSEEEQLAEITSLRASIVAGDAGKVRPAKEVYARVRASVIQNVQK